MGVVEVAHIHGEGMIDGWPDIPFYSRHTMLLASFYETCNRREINLG